jgi:hypothetical protein
MAKASKGNTIFWKLLWPLRLAVAVVLPFFVLIRLSVFLHVSLQAPVWAALGTGSFLTFLLLYFYLNYLTRLISGKKKTKDKAKRFNLRAALIVMGAFTSFTLLYISASNVKTSTVQSEYSSMHPLLRIAVSVLVLFDRDAVITDMARSHADYAEMNLAEKKRSLHYPQTDGYVHALDLRTKGRGNGRNQWIDAYFRVMGFRTLRHTGTEDHLHVSLMIHDNPNAL